MHNLIPLNQLNGYDEDNDLITEYYECLVECDDRQSECKRICKEVLIRSQDSNIKNKPLTFLVRGFIMEETIIMNNPLSFVKNVRTVYDRFYQKNVKEVQVQFLDEDPAWIPYETLISMLSLDIDKRHTEWKK